MNGFYGADMAGAPTSLTSVTYTPLGVCVPTSQYPGVGGVIFSADATNKLFASYFATSSCGAQAAHTVPVKPVPHGMAARRDVVEVVDGV